MGAKLPSLPPGRRAAGPDQEAEIIRRIDQEGARQRALLELEWRRARDERIRQTEAEALRPSAPVAPPKPWWADLQPVAAPEPAPAPAPEPFYDGHDIDDGEEEVEVEPAPAPTVERINAGAIAERLQGLSHAQLLQVAEAFSEDGDDEASLRRNLTEYVDGWADDAADDARGDPEAAREAGRREAIGFLAEEIAAAVAMPPSDGDDDASVDGPAPFANAAAGGVDTAR